MAKVLDAVIAGAQRSGTTWLALCLDQHPDVTLAQHKEAHLFDSEDVQINGLSQKRLMEKFPKASLKNIWLDATPSYLYIPGSLESLRTHNPEAKVIAVVRDPAQRAISHFYHSRWLGIENLSLARALLSEDLRIKRQHFSKYKFADPVRQFSYADRGRYSGQISRLLDLFPDALIIPFPKIMASPDLVLAQVQRFLGLGFQKLDPLPPQNSHGARPNHILARWVITRYLHQDTHCLLERLGWDADALLERPPV